MLPILFETDIGRDPDDLAALCYLIMADANISIISCTPGDKDQLSLTRHILNLLGKDNIVVIPSRKTRIPGINSVNELHRSFIGDIDWTYSGEDRDSVVSSLGEYIYFVTGPLDLFPEKKPVKFLMQGGFAPYSMYEPKVKLEKFIDQEYVPTFNLNGNKKNGKIVVDKDWNKSFVGKNVCHSMSMTREMTDNISENTKAGIVFKDFMKHRFKTNKESKAMHDVVAAVMLLHPELGIWIQGKPIYHNGKWGTTNTGENLGSVLVDIDRDKFWSEVYCPTQNR